MIKDKKKPQAPTKNPAKNSKVPNFELPEDIKNDIQDSFNFYDNDKSGYINRQQMRSILGNFGFVNKNVKEIENELREDFDSAKNDFSFQEVLSIISKKWFYSKGRDEEIDEMFEIFDKKNKNQVALSEIKTVFANYLDIQISDSDILEFIQEADLDQDGYINKQEFAQKMGYI